MKCQWEKILWFIDNASSHEVLRVVKHRSEIPTYKYNVQTDLGIIRAFKARYRKFLLQHIACKIDDCTSVAELLKAVSVLDPICWSVKS